jgi:hypothetical protein
VAQKAFLYVPGAKAKFPGLTSSGASQHGVHAGQQLFLIKGLAEVIIGTRPKSINALVPAISRREDDDGGGVARTSPAAKALKARCAGEAKVKDDQVDHALCKLEENFIVI